MCLKVSWRENILNLLCIDNTEKGKKIYYVWFWNEKGLHIQSNQWKTLRQEVIRENEWLFGMITVKQNTEKAQRHSPISYQNNI